MIPYKIENLGNELFIIYFGKLFEYKYENVEMYYSFDKNWTEIKIEKMVKTENGFTAKILFGEYKYLYFCFSCEDGSWDSNFGSNYSINISDVMQNNSKIADEASNEVNIKDRGTLLISETKGKIFLPYKVEEIEAIIKDTSNSYQTAR